MKIIAPTNNKGGVGKTKLSTLLAEYFSIVENKKVLGVDFDPQCNFSSHFLKMELDPSAPEGLMPPIHPDYDPNDNSFSMTEDGRSSIADIFYGKPILPYPTYIKNLEIAPGHAERLQSAEAVRKNEVMEKVHKQLGLFLNLPEVQEAYDIVIIDTAPSKGPLTVSVIKTATDIIIPSVMENKPIQGIYGMLQLWKQEALTRESTSEPLNLVGILANMFRRTTLHESMYESLANNKAIADYVLPLKLGLRTVYGEIDSDGVIPKSIFDLPENNPAREEVLSVCKLISKRIFKDG